MAICNNDILASYRSWQGESKLIPNRRHFGFWQCRLPDFTTYFGTNLKKHCSDIFPSHILAFEKMCADDIVCSSLGLKELIM
jgi:hypothetical protein